MKKPARQMEMFSEFSAAILLVFVADESLNQSLSGFRHMYEERS